MEEEEENEDDEEKEDLCLHMLECETSPNSDILSSSRNPEDIQNNLKKHSRMLMWEQQQRGSNENKPTLARKHFAAFEALQNQDLKFKKRKDKTSIKGSMYEIKMSALMFLRLLNTGKSFYLCSNLDDAGAFDDVVFKYNSTETDGSASTVFLQLKHSENSSKKSVSLLNEKHAFGIVKYFKSFCEILGNQSTNNVILDDLSEKRVFILYTNADVNRDMFSTCKLEEVMESHCLVRTGGEILRVKDHIFQEIEKYKVFVEATQGILSDSEKCMEAKEEIISKECDSVLNVLSYEELKTKVNMVRLMNSKVIANLTNEVHVLDIPVIKEFSKCFFVFSKQSNECNLDDFIHKEMSESFHNLQLSEIEKRKMFRSLLDKIQNWWEENDLSVFLTEESTIWRRILENTIGERFCTRSQNLKRHGIQFTHQSLLEMSDCLNHENRTTVIVTSGNLTTFTTLKVQQILEFKKLQFYILATLEQCMNDDSDIWKVWPSSWCSLLIVEIEDNSSLSEWFLKKIQNIIMNNETASVILIISQKQEKCILPIVKDVSYASIKDKFNYNQLDSRSQELLHQKYVCFQGFSTDLKTILTEENFQLFSSDTLTMIITDEIKTLGEDIQKKQLHNYIPRSLGRKVLSENFLKNNLSTTVIAFESDSENQIKNFLKEGDELYELSAGKLIVPYKNLPPSKQSEINFQNTCVYLKFNKGKEIDEFKILCKMSPNVHWVKVVDSSLVWEKSHGDINDVKTFVMGTFVETQKELVNTLKNSTVIVIAEPGMGKTTLLNNIALELKKIHCDKWVVVIDLLKQCEFLGKTRKEDISIDFCREFIIHSINLKQTEREVLNEFLSDLNRVVLLVDAFDEISPDYADRVCSILNHLQDKTYALFVTSRPNMSLYLEQNLCVCSCTLRPLNENDQIEFLRKFWCKEHPKLDFEKVVYFAKELLDLYSLSLKDPSKSFTGIPLQIQMLAEVYQDSVQEYIQGSETHKLQEMNIIEIFEEFVEKKIKIFFKSKLNMTGMNPTENEIFLKIKEDFLKNHKIAALLTLFNSKDLDIQYKNRLQQSISEFLKSLENGNERTGIIDGINNGLAHFIHRSFAEYFGAMWIAEHYDEETSSVLKNILFQDDMSTMRRFLDFKLAAKCQLHISVLTFDSDNIEKLLHDDKVNINDVDGAERTALHLAASYGDENTIYTILYFGADVNRKDCSDLKPLNYAELSRSWEAVELLLLKGGQPKDLKIVENSCEYKNIQIEAVYVSCMKGLFNIMRVILAYTDFDINSSICIPDTFHNKSPTFKSSIKNDFLPLILSTAQSHTKVATLLIEHGANIKLKDRYENTVLHVASEFGNFNIARLAILKAITAGYKLPDYVNCVNKQGNTALHLAAVSGSEDIVELLLKHGADVNILNEKQDNPVLSASRMGNINIIKNLIENGGILEHKNANGESAFSVVICEGYVEAVKLFINLGLDVDYICDTVCNTPLLLASSLGHISIVHLLFDMKCDVNHENKSGETALTLALEGGYLDIAKLILNRSAEIKNKNSLANALLLASIKGYLDVVKIIFLNSKDSFPCASKLNQNCFHLAAAYGHLDILKFVLEKKLFDVKFVNYDSENALHITSRKGFYDIAKYLVDSGIEIDSVNKDGDTAFLISLRNCFFNIAEYLIKKKTNFDHVNNRGDNASILCAENGPPEMMKSLIELGITLNLVNIYGNNALITAIKHNNIKTSILLTEIMDTAINHINNRGESALLLVSRKGNFECLKCLIKRGADIYHCDKDGNTALHLATKCGRLDMVMYLIDKYKNIDISNKIGDTALLVACKNGHTHIVKKLIERNSSLDCRNNMGDRPLYVALKRNFLDIAKYILAHRELDWINKSLLLACSDHNLEAIKFLLKAGGDIDYYADELQETPLLNAVYGGFVEHVKFLVESGASIKGCGLRPEPFHEAAANGQVHIMAYLMSRGIKVDEYKRGKTTALIVAAKFGKLEAVKLLVENEANVNHVNIYGESALYIATDRNHLKVVEYLINFVTECGIISTAFMRAVLNNNVNIVKALLAVGADVNVSDNDSNSPLLYSSKYGYKEIFHLLMENSADVNFKNNWGDTALTLAFKNNQIRFVEYLINKGGAFVEDIESLVNSDWLFNTKPADVESILSVLSSKNAKPVHIISEKNEILIRSSKDGRFEILKYIIDLNVDIDYCDGFLNNSLIFAAKSGSYEAVRLLVQKCINVNHTNKFGVSALLAAAQNGSFDIVKYLIANGSDICHVDKRGNNALLLAGKKGHINIIKFLISKEIDIRHTNNNGDNLLILSSYNGHLNIVKLALHHELNIAHVNLHGMSPLLAAVSGQHLDIVQFLVEKGVLVDAVNKWGYSSIILAAKKGNVRIVKYLIRMNADIAVTDSWGHTALHWSSDRDYVDIVMLLAEKMNKVDVINVNGETPLMLAVRKDHIKIARILVAEGANINLANAKLQTCLMIASFEGHSDILKYLLKHRVEINKSDIDGETALFYATRQGRAKTVQYLLEHEADIKHLNLKGENVLKISLQCGYVLIPKLFYKYGLAS